MHRRPDPGRVTSRRLNRVEYNNTIRDLLGVTIRPADEFPIDDSGYGFDNIGDVLSLSPMLMEKYVNAARVVARAAVFGEAYPEKPGQLIVLTPKKMQDDLQTKGNETPYSMRGTLYATYHFPVDGEYEFRWRYGNYRGRGKPVGPGRPFASAEAAPADAAAVGRRRAAGTRTRPWPRTRSRSGRAAPAANRRRTESAGGEASPGLSADSDDLQHRRYTGGERLRRRRRQLQLLARRQRRAGESDRGRPPVARVLAGSGEPSEPVRPDQRRRPPGAVRRLHAGPRPVQPFGSFADGQQADLRLRRELACVRPSDRDEPHHARLPSASHAGRSAAAARYRERRPQRGPARARRAACDRGGARLAQFPVQNRKGSSLSSGRCRTS